jgi:hypothetical protein
MTIGTLKFTLSFDGDRLYVNANAFSTRDVDILIVVLGYTGRMMETCRAVREQDPASQDTLL